MSKSLFDLKGKVALVTGGNRGIGLGMASGLAKHGAAIAVWGTNDRKNTEALDHFRSQDVSAKAWIVDVSDEARVKAATQEVVDHFGRIDVCVANAGIGGYGGPFEDLDTSVYRRVMAVNMDGTFFTLRACAKHMVERAKQGDAGGSLICVSSTAAVSGASRNEHYAATKGGAISMIKGIAVELARYKIRANSVLPGFIYTDIVKDKLDTEKFHDRVLPRIPARRWGEPEDFAGVAVYLASDASAYQTGQEFVIDGGYTVF